MHIPKKIALGVASAAIAGTALMGGTVAYAQSGETTGDTLVDKIATKFNLNEGEVKALFEEHRQEQQAEREADWQEKLDAAVQSGELTEAQKQLITEKRAELKTKLEAMKPQNPGDFADQTDEERQTRRDEMKAQHDELQQWAEDNDIELHWLMGAGDSGGRGLHMKFNGGDQPPADMRVDTVQQ